MYIAVNMELAHIDLNRAIRFAIRRETFIDILSALNKRTDYYKFQVYYIA